MKIERTKGTVSNYKRTMYFLITGIVGIIIGEATMFFLIYGIHNETIQFVAALGIILFLTTALLGACYGIACAQRAEQEEYESYS